MHETESVNNIINYLQKQAFRTTYVDKLSAFQGFIFTLLYFNFMLYWFNKNKSVDSDNSISNQHWNVEALVSEMFKVKGAL